MMTMRDIVCSFAQLYVSTADSWQSQLANRRKSFWGHTVKRNDGYLLMMLDLTPTDVLLKYFWQGQVVGKEEEKQRLAQVIHDSFSPHLLAALFLIHGIRE